MTISGDEAFLLVFLLEHYEELELQGKAKKALESLGSESQGSEVVESEVMESESLGSESTQTKMKKKKHKKKTTDWTATMLFLIMFKLARVIMPTVELGIKQSLITHKNISEKMKMNLFLLAGL